MPAIMLRSGRRHIVLSNDPPCCMVDQMTVNPPPSRVSDPVFSAVIPFYDEEDNVTPLLRELADVLDELGRPYEIVCVDDGSKDGTRGVIDRFAAN